MRPADGSSSVVGNPEFAPTARRGRRDDKLEGVAHLGMVGGGWTGSKKG